MFGACHHVPIHSHRCDFAYSCYSQRTEVWPPAFYTAVQQHLVLASLFLLVSVIHMTNQVLLDHFRAGSLTANVNTINRADMLRRPYAVGITPLTTHNTRPPTHTSPPSLFQADGQPRTFRGTDSVWCWLFPHITCAMFIHILRFSNAGTPRA